MNNDLFPSGNFLYVLGEGMNTMNLHKLIHLGLKTINYAKVTNRF